MEVREKWFQFWQNLLKDPLTRASRKSYGTDQILLERWVWPWGKYLVMEHNSYT